MCYRIETTVHYQVVWLFLLILFFVSSFTIASLAVHTQQETHSTMVVILVIKTNYINHPEEWSFPLCKRTIDLLHSRF